MQVIATGKWSKALKRFQMVVAIRRPGKEAPSRRQPTRPSGKS
ncbi:MAG: hypothetical protein U0531_21765 [Dehalococcoidia bacterium]